MAWAALVIWYGLRNLARTKILQNIWLNLVYICFVCFSFISKHFIDKLSSDFLMTGQGDRLSRLQRMKASGTAFLIRNL